MRILPIIAIFAASMPIVPALAQSQAAQSSTVGYSIETTELGTLLDDPAAKAVLVKQIPDVVSSEQIDMARTMTLKQLQQYAGDRVTDEKLTAIQADLNKLTMK